MIISRFIHVAANGIVSFFYDESLSIVGFPGGTVVKNLPSTAGVLRDVGLISGSGRSPGSPTPVFLPGESHGQRSLEGYSP